MLVRLSTSCARKLMDSCALNFRGWVGASVGSCTITLFCALERVVIICSSNGEYVVKRNRHDGSSSMLGEAFDVAVVVGASTFIINYCVMISTTSRRILYRLVLVAVAVAQAGITSLVEVLVSTASVKARDFLAIS